MSNNLTSDLTGQVAIVTGGGRGLGRAIALALASAGANVVVADRATSDTAATIEASGGRAAAKTVDVTDQSAVEATVREVEQQYGAVDLLMNNAGIGAESLGRLWEVDPEWWWRTIDVDLRGPFVCARAVLPGMIRRRRGRIVNMSSGVAWGDIAGVTAYCAAKAGLARLSGCLALETREFGIAIFAINPGMVLTPLNEAVMASTAGLKISTDMAAGFARGDGAPPELCAQLVVQLASGKADSLSGRFLDVDDDLDELVRRADEITRHDLYSLKRPTFKRESVQS
jgi:NAD(P)-dependent dehydrogenase (short-subunit alcohol dehydrogenase family)